MKNMPKKVRKGSTLAEICVVLAVVSIVSTVVLSFCMMANRRAVASANRLRIMEERKMIETIVETWCDSMAAEEQDISLEFINSQITLDRSGMLTATMPEGPDIQFKCDAAKTMMFNVIPSENDVLIVCTVEFNAIGADLINPPKYVFVVNPRSGESIFVESEQTAQPDDSKPTEPPVTPAEEQEKQEEQNDQ